MNSDVTIYGDSETLSTIDSLDVNVKDKSFEYGNAVNLKNTIKKVNKDYSYSIVKDLDMEK